MYVTASAYIPLCTEGCSGITATGVDVTSSVNYDGAKIIAVDPSVIPLYSIVKVYPHDRSPFYAYAMDTGGAIQGYRIDVLVGDTDTAMQFGRQRNVKLEILREGKGK